MRGGRALLGVKTFWSRFRVEPKRWKVGIVQHGGEDGEATALEATDDPRSWTTRRGAAGDMGGRKPIPLRSRLVDLSGTARGHHPEHGEGHGEPDALGAAWVAHLGLFPMPSVAFEIFIAAFNPRAQAIPGDIGVVGWQIGQE